MEKLIFEINSSYNLEIFEEEDKLKICETGFHDLIGAYNILERLETDTDFDIELVEIKDLRHYYKIKEEIYVLTKIKILNETNRETYLEKVEGDVLWR